MGRDAPKRAALLGVLVNAALAIAKLTAGIVGHSFALVADATESLVDIAGSGLVWAAFIYGDRPADEDHPFGHGKIEAMAGMAVSLLVVGVAVWIAIEAVHFIMVPHAMPRPFTLAVLVVVIVVKEIMFRVARHAARKSGSTAGHAEAWHHRADAITSLFAMVGISIALLGGPDWAPADDWAALAASAVILINGLLIARLPFEELMDRHLPEIADEAERIAMAHPDVRRIERCDARRSGRGYRIVMHTEVDPEMTVEASHRLTGVVKEQIRGALPGVDSVLIHIEPHHPAPDLTPHAEPKPERTAASGSTGMFSDD
ncbi:MAG: cation transporter [Phycisphaeraceae bacterium]|nr:MAG: cation transporter [Phycisphaeraceae bacterium]